MKRVTHVLEGKNRNRKDQTIMEEDEFSSTSSSKTIIRLRSASSTTSGNFQNVKQPGEQKRTDILNVGEWIPNGRVHPIEENKVQLKGSKSHEEVKCSPWTAR